MAPRAGFEPATRSTSSSVARVTAVHTLGRLPQAADRAILPQRIQNWMGREPGYCHLGNPASGKEAKIKLSRQRLMDKWA
jgi:hypothetical protein